jgi:nitrate/nitrite transporter NarK
MKYSAKQTIRDIENGTNHEPEEHVGWTRNYWLAMIFMGLRGMPFRCATLMMPIYLVDSYGFEPVWAGSLTAIMLTAGLFGELVSAPISDRSGKRVPYMFLSVASMVPLFYLLNLSLEMGPLLLVLIGIGFIYFFGVPPGQAFETEVSPTERQGLAFGLLFSIGAIPGSLSPMIFGWIGDVYGLQMSILFLVIVSGLAAIVALFMKDGPDAREVTVSLAIEE